MIGYEKAERKIYRKQNAEATLVEKKIVDGVKGKPSSSSYLSSRSLKK